MAAPPGDRGTEGQRDEGTDGGTEGHTLGVTGVEPRTNNAAFSSEPSRRVRELPGLRTSSAISTAHVHKLMSFLAVITLKYDYFLRPQGRCRIKGTQAPEGGC